MKYLQLFLSIFLTIISLEASEAQVKTNLELVPQIEQEQIEIFEDMLNELQSTSKSFLLQLLYYDIKYYNGLENIMELMESLPPRVDSRNYSLLLQKALRGRKNYSINKIMQKMRNDIKDDIQIALIKDTYDLALNLTLVEENPTDGLIKIYNHVRSKLPGEFQISEGNDKGKELPIFIGIEND